MGWREVGVEPPKDREGRNKWGYLVKMCGIGGCEYKTGHSTSMRNQWVAKHGIEEKFVRKPIYL